jgi:NAD(P)-dependent dehydrogenase (short-subunit alcohol dehydrogenase family)
MDISLDGKVALVTGTGPNIGSGLALALAKYGAKVACNDLRPDAAEAAVRRIERNDGVAMAIPGDVSDEDDVKGYVQKVVDTWGKIDILVNCAGILGGKSVLEYELADFNRQLLVNCTGNFLNTKHVGHSMIDHQIKGSIICIASSAAWTGQPNNIGYCTSKGGIVNFVRAAAMDLAPFGIRVNSFTPVATQPDNPELLAAGRRGANRSATVPLGEQPTPTDYGHLLAFLASDYARLITGTDFRVDGGAGAKHWRYMPEGGMVGPLPLITMESTEA